jgi:hypothetical protein
MSKRLALAFVAVVLLSAGLLFVRPPQARAVPANSPSNVLLLHGFSPDGAVNCNQNPTWGTVKTYFQSHGIANVKTLKFYNNDTNCDLTVTDDNRCSNWYPGNEGTVNEDIRHTTCNLAWYIYSWYTMYGTNVGVVAHSMGGILIRQAMNDTPYIIQFPPYLTIYDVATAGSPHQGVLSGAALVGAIGAFIGVGSCIYPCLEANQMERANALMSNMNSTSFRGGFARNPQGNGGTDWTTMASNFDELLLHACTSSNDMMGAPGGQLDVWNTTACGLMPGAKHFVVYPGTSPTYDHGGYLTDTNTNWNAREIYSDNTGGTWADVPNSEHSIFTLNYAMRYSTW